MTMTKGKTATLMRMVRPVWPSCGCLYCRNLTPVPASYEAGIEGFEDWRVDDDLGDREHGADGYDDDADWNHDVQVLAVSNSTLSCSCVKRTEFWE